MSAAFEVIVIGGDVNGLVTANYLARVGLRVVVLEPRSVLGGLVANVEFHPGFRVCLAGDGAPLLVDSIRRDLLPELEPYERAALVTSLAVDGPAVTIWRDAGRTSAELARRSAADAGKLEPFARTMLKYADALATTMTLTPPTPRVRPAELLPWSRVGLRLRRLGGRDMMELLRILPLSAGELLDEWFIDDALKGILAAGALHGSLASPYASGTAYTMLYQRLGAAGGGAALRGGAAAVIGQLAELAHGRGVELRTDAVVEAITLRGGRAVGVTLVNGEAIDARVVVSSLDVRRTLFDLVGARHLDLTTVRRVRAARLRGSTAWVNLALDGLPNFRGFEPGDPRLAAPLVFAPSLAYIDRAHDDAKYGAPSSRPVLALSIPTLDDPTLAPAGQHVLSVRVQFAPFDLADGDWDARRDRFGDAVISQVAELAPDLEARIVGRQVVTPLDLQRDYGLTHGDVLGGQMALDQLLFMRPIASAAQYRAPIENLYLCGDTTHPGGGLSGAPGHNAAREILRAWRRP